MATQNLVVRPDSGLGDKPGVYLIRCKANGAAYVGSSAKLLSRLQAHTNSLRSGQHSVRLLQRDWRRHGEDQFEFLGCHKPLEGLLGIEERLITLSRSLDDSGGFNRMLGQRAWSLSSRIRNTEAKLIRSRRFVMLPDVDRDGRFNTAYVLSFTQRSTPFRVSEPLLCNALMANSENGAALEEQLTLYSRFSPS